VGLKTVGAAMGIFAVIFTFFALIVLVAIFPKGLVAKICSVRVRAPQFSNQCPTVQYLIHNVP
jgi:hypothetical protein